MGALGDSVVGKAARQSRVTSQMAHLVAVLARFTGRAPSQLKSLQAASLRLCQYFPHKCVTCHQHSMSPLSVPSSRNTLFAISRSVSAGLRRAISAYLVERALKVDNIFPGPR